MLLPKFFTCLKQGYSKETFFKDLFSGITIGIISLPLIMAFSIASGLPPERGLFTGIVAGFLISFLGGSRVQIGGPTGAFVVVIYSIVERHGYEGLVIASILAGLIMIIMALVKAGSLLKYIPYPVVTGFTAGIALVIFSSQIKDFFGLPIDKVPADFLEKWKLYLNHFASFNPWALGLGIGSIALIVFLKKKFPKIPGPAVAVGIGTLIAYLFHFPIETIETKFGGIPPMLPSPSFPHITFHQIQLLLPDAITIALLSSIESLLSAVVADKMTGFRHRSGAELLAHGVANIVSPLFGGIPATGAIARTAANARMGASTPFAGIMHAITLFILMAFFAIPAGKIPLAILAAVLLYVAWNMSEIDQIVKQCKGPKSDRLMLFTTMILTVLIDITVAVEVGVVLAAFIFLKKMAKHTKIGPADLEEPIPPNVAVYDVNGPLFYGISDELHKNFHSLDPKPQAFIFRLHKAPLVDTTAINALQELAHLCKKHDTRFLLSGVNEELKPLFETMGLKGIPLCTTFKEALSQVVDKKAENAVS